MADPEQIYQEVLAEEQAKGSASAVAEARAKAARQRAVHGSPHPKEPRWWPGSQPQFEGGDGAPAAEPAGDEDDVADEAPAAAAPTIEAAAAQAATEEVPPAPEEPVATPQELTRDLPAAPAEPLQPAAATAPVPAAAAAPIAAPAAAATATLPSGVTHGTASGNRLRPEDAVTTDAQFDAQAALHQRRKMIDELVATGVPAVAATAEPRGAGAGMLLLYLLIPLLAIGFLVGNQNELAGAEGTGEVAAPEGGGEAAGLTIAAANVAFDKDTLTIPVDGAPLQFVNDDSVEHNVSIYETEAADKEIFKGQIIPGGQQTTYEIPAHEKGDYYFQCDVHPGMNGTATFE
ncbi:MAG: cupredoxin domain-containing protein [Actinomycetota bacterium]|nr:cupredoxin domain-containing protein [Actinomycetota bacterium]